MKAYIIMEKGFEYDDNYYNPTEGGSPMKVYFNRLDAQSDLDKYEISFVKANNIRDFLSYDIEDNLNVDEEEFLAYTKSLNEKYGIPTPKNSWERLGEHQLNPMANDEESKKYLSMVSQKFYEIEEVEVDVPSFRNYKISQVLL